MHTDFKDKIDIEKIIPYDSEYHYGNTRKPEWKFKNATLAVQTYRVGTGEIIQINCLKEPNHWDRIFKLLDKGYILVAHNAIADVRGDLCPRQIIKYLINGQVHCTLYRERLINGLTEAYGDNNFHIEKKNIIQQQEEEEETSEELFEESVYTTYNKHSLKDLAFRYKGIILDKGFQNAKWYINPDISQGALDYAKKDVEFLLEIYLMQQKRIEQLGLEEQVDLNNKLIATSYIIHEYGIPIDLDELNRLKVEYTVKASEAMEKLMAELPKVSRTENQLSELFIDLHWKPKIGLAGYPPLTVTTSKGLAEILVNPNKSWNDVVQHCIKKAIRKSWDHLAQDYNNIRSYREAWVNNNREKFKVVPNLNYFKHKLEAFNSLGINIKSTGKDVIQDYQMKYDHPVLQKYITYQDVQTILSKTLNHIVYGKYLRPNNTVKGILDNTVTKTGRTSAKDMNFQNLNRDLKSIFGTPPGMVAIEYDLSQIELQMVMDRYPDEGVKEFVKAVDSHCMAAMRYFSHMQEFRDHFKGFDDLFKARKEGDKLADKFRQASKTVTYFSLFRSPSDEDSTYMPGTNMLREIFRTRLGWDLSKEDATTIIKETENLFFAWTEKKRSLRRQIKRKWVELEEEASKLEKGESLPVAKYLIALKNRSRGLFYQFHITKSTPPLYKPPTKVLDSATGEIITESEYINERSVASCMIQGDTATAAKSALETLQRELFTRYGSDKARCNLFIHDSYRCYVTPDIVEEVKPLIIESILKPVYQYGQFTWLPVKIEGGILSKTLKEKDIWVYDGQKIYKE